MNVVVLSQLQGIFIFYNVEIDCKIYLTNDKFCGITDNVV
jgi:hypothetical protein